MQDENKTANTEQAKEETYLGDFIKLDVLLVDLFKAFKRFWWTAVIFVAVFCAVAYSYCSRNYKPYYTAQASFSISSENTSAIASGASSFSSYYNSGIAEQLSKTFSYIINSETMRSILYEELGTNSLNGAISARNNVESAPIFTITVTSSSPQDAYDILQAVIENYPRLAQYIIGETQMSVFTQPKMPTEPTNPFSCKKELVIAVAAGLLLSFAIMAFYALTRNTVRQRDDIKTKLNQKCLVEVPWVNVKKRKNKAETMVTISNKHAGFSEAFRYLKRRVVNHLDRHGQKIVAVTSAYPGEGKTTVSYNLALSIAQSGKKVALLDMDLSRKSLQKYLNITDNKPGIIDFIYNKCEIKDIITKSDFGLNIFFAGNGRPKKFQHQDYDTLLDYVKENYEYVIMDAAPTALVSDTAQIMSRADETVFVLRQDYTPVEKVRESIRYVYDVDAKIMGFVFNAVSEGFEGYKGSYYGYNYGSYYGRKYGYYGKRYGYGKKYGYSGYGSGYGYGYGSRSGKKKGYGYGYGYGGESNGYGYGYGAYGGTNGGEFIKERIKGEGEEE